MTREEFSNTSFKAGMYATYDGKEYPVVSANFIEDLFGLSLDDDDEYDPMWVRCENVSNIRYS